jgi:hypothetical protein
LQISDRERCRHTFVFGTTGVGKTRLSEQLIVQDLLKGYSVVYIDPKGDQQIFSTIYAAAQQAGRLDELMLVTPVFPQYSVKIDPLSTFFMPDELVGHVIAGVSAGRDPFFRNIAKEITTAVITAELLLTQEGKRNNPLNFDLVRRLIRRETMQETVRDLRGLHTPEAQSVIGMLDDILNAPQDYYGKISSSLRTALMELSAGSMGAIIGQADSNRFISLLEQGKPVIVVVHTGALITREASATLGKVLLSMIQSFVGRILLSDRGRVTPPLAIQRSMRWKVTPCREVVTFSSRISNLSLGLDMAQASSLVDTVDVELFSGGVRGPIPEPVRRYAADQVRGVSEVHGAAPAPAFLAQSQIAF